MPGVHTFYDGSRILEPVAEGIGVEVDMLNLVFCQVISIPMAILYRNYLGPEKVSREIRLWSSMAVGLVLCYFCYGNAIKHPLALIAVSYSIMRFSPTIYVHKLVFCFAMGYLIFIHWFRWYILTSYSIDITGPMMVLTQKVTTMAFSLHDGKVKKAEELTPIQKREAIGEVPSVLEFMSYLFHFQTVLTGPLCFYTDYIQFIDGNDMTPEERKRLNVWQGALPKLLSALAFLTIVAVSHEAYKPEIVLQPEILRLPFYKWWVLFWLVIVLKRFQYYYAWTIADGIANLSGFGFNGYDENHRPRWDLISNVNWLKVELAFNFKDTLDNWNITTMYWLRRVAYERAPKKYSTVATYMLSAMWHGFFLGYYLTFLTGALMTLSARTARRCLRHRFQINLFWSRFYDVLTFIATKTALAYTTFPFVTLHLYPAIYLYKQVYFSHHIGGLLIIFLLPLVLPPQPRSVDVKKVK
ncbi:unnamed protein product [Bursaphelenchus xylophilus]|uniref:(pine wood nematode) hypothetical protein n=1 Tax=Bursaphelenchus xylophilus TaxID=6326 RepID=A0A1I7SD55_BURXY|nr:unnamed protein product [Bursaphelenchus xylophilus]CAG9130507.1 unnamed protein product [Bursaphelenchus xylophilus]